MLSKITSVLTLVSEFDAIIMNLSLYQLTISISSFAPKQSFQGKELKK